MNLDTYTRQVMRAAPLFNAPVKALANSRLIGRFVGRNVAIITYTGRRSGRTISTPVTATVIPTATASGDHPGSGRAANSPTRLTAHNAAARAASR